MKLSEENQKWFNIHNHGAFYQDDVEEKLLEMQQRIDELESQIDFKIKECIELAQGLNRYKNDYFDTKKRIDELEKARDEQSQQLSDRESRMSGYIKEIQELEEENAELKQVIAINRFLTCGPSFEECKESLAQNNKEVIESFVEDCKDSDMLTNIEKLTLHTLMIKHLKFLEQLQQPD